MTDGSQTLPERDDFVSWLSAQTTPPGEGRVIHAGGVSYVKKTETGQSSFSLPNLLNFSPYGGILDILHCGSTSELDADFAGIFKQAVDDAVAKGWKLRVSQKRDGTPFEYDFIDHILEGDLDIIFDRRAVWMPRTNFQHFPTGGSTGPFVITDFPYDAATWGRLSAMLVAQDGEETTLDVTASGASVTLDEVPAMNSTLVLTGRKNALDFRAGTMSSPGSGTSIPKSITINAEGVLNMDLSRYGYVLANASGSGFATKNIDHIFFRGDIVVSSGRENGYGAHPLAKRGDSGFTPLNFKSCHVDRVIATGMNDLAVYSSGGGSIGIEDNSRGLNINQIIAERCNNAWKHVRGAEQASVGTIQTLECNTSFLHGTTNSISTGQGIHIGSINAIRQGRRIIDIREIPQGGIHIGAISCRDFGYLPDGTTETVRAAGLFLAEVAGVQIDYVDIRRDKWNKRIGVPAILFSRNNNFGNRILGGWIDGVDIGIEENSTTINDVGNNCTLTLKDVTTPLLIHNGIASKYDLTVLTETATITAERQRVPDLIDETPQTGTPMFVLAGALGTPEYAYSVQKLQYQRIVNRMHFSFEVAAVVTHDETDKQLIVELPFTANGVAGQVTNLTVGFLRGFDLPNPGDTVPPAPGTAWQQIVAEMPNGANHVRFRWTREDVTPGGLISSDDIPSGTAIRVSVSGDVAIA